MEARKIKISMDPVEFHLSLIGVINKLSKSEVEVLAELLKFKENEMGYISVTSVHREAISYSIGKTATYVSYNIKSLGVKGILCSHTKIPVDGKRADMYKIKEGIRYEGETKWEISC